MTNGNPVWNKMKARTLVQWKELTTLLELSFPFNSNSQRSVGWLLLFERKMCQGTKQQREEEDLVFESFLSFIWRRRRQTSLSTYVAVLLRHKFELENGRSFFRTTRSTSRSTGSLVLQDSVGQGTNNESFLGHECRSWDFLGPSTQAPGRWWRWQDI